jgi:hypothetical protein
MITDPAEIQKWLFQRAMMRRGSPNDYTVTPDGVVNSNSDMYLQRCEGIPIQLGTINGNFSFAGTSSADSFEGFPHTIKGHFSLYTSKINSVTGIDKVIKCINGDIVLNHNSTHLLGLLLIQGVNKIDVDRGPVDVILNKYLGTGDILSAQDELIDAGFIDQARL